MSPGPSQRAYRWGEWVGIYSIDGYALLRLGGFIHHCGPAATLVNNFEHDSDQMVCSGCRTEIQRPVQECKPLYVRKNDTS